MPPAPATLVPRVMAAIRRRQVWYARPWLLWPRGWQAASVAGLAVLMAGVAVVAPQALALAANWLSGPVAQVSTLVEDAGATVRVARVLRGTLLLPVFGYVLGLMALMGATCAGLGVALGRVVLGREI